MLILPFWYFCHTGIVLFHLVLSMGLCPAQGGASLHLDFAVLFDHFDFNAVFSVLTALSCVILISCLAGSFTPLSERIHSLNACWRPTVWGSLGCSLEYSYARQRVALCPAELQTKKMICTEQGWGAGKASLPHKSWCSREGFLCCHL